MNAREAAIALADGGPVKRSGADWMVRCPAHDDAVPSLTLGDGREGLVWHCHAGCTQEAVGALIQPLLEDAPWLPASAQETIYGYTDEQGKPLFEVVRRPDKRFLQRQPDRTQEGGYRWNALGVRRVLYHLPEVIDAANAGRDVWITEGEKDADILRRHVCATTWPGGAGKWREEYAAVLANGSVTLWADADEPGRKAMRAVRDSLVAVGASVRIVESAYGKDAHDHLSHGLSVDDVLVTVPYAAPDTETLFLRADAYLDQDAHRGEWAVRTLLRQGEVLMLTGFEGWGKSAMLKQFAVCAAIGYHPFDLAKIGDPVRVLYIDCENTRADCQEDFNRLREVAVSEGHWDDPPLFIHDRTEMNLGRADDLSWLMERVHAHQPDLLVIGPVYDLVVGDIGREEVAQALKRGINMVRSMFGCAVMLEHHAPHRNAGETREVRPIGSSLLMRWPSFGFGLLPTGEVHEPFTFYPWRGGRRRGRSWPEKVVQTGSAEAGWFWQRFESYS